MIPKSVQYFILHFILSILFFTTSVDAQNKADIFNPELPLTWMGVDYSEVRYTGDAGDVTTLQMKDYFIKINEMILEETTKFNLEKTFSKTTVNRNIELIRKRTNDLDTGLIMAGKIIELNRLNKYKIINLVNSYETGSLTGLACVIIMEDISKTWEQATMVLAYFNAGTKEVLLTVPLTGEASGIGFRNHWASVIDNAMQKFYSRDYKNLKKIYYPKKK